MAEKSKPTMPFDSREEILGLESRYSYPKDEEHVRTALAEARSRGYLTVEDLSLAAEWKWRGNATKLLVCQNSEENAKEASQFAFRAKSERLRIYSLLSLIGVSWPMASVILHVAYLNSHPNGHFEESVCSGVLRRF